MFLCVTSVKRSQWSIYRLLWISTIVCYYTRSVLSGIEVSIACCYVVIKNLHLCNNSQWHFEWHNYSTWGWLEQIYSFYRELRLKNFNKGENVSQLSYTSTQYYYFNSNYSGSGLSESDVICTINIPLMVSKFVMQSCPTKFNHFV